MAEALEEWLEEGADKAFRFYRDSCTMYPSLSRSRAGWGPNTRGITSVSQYGMQEFLFTGF